MTEQLILIGGGGHCKACIDVIEQEGRYAIAGIIDSPSKVGQVVQDYKVLGSDNAIKDLHKAGHSFLITLGQIKSPARRIELFIVLEQLGANLPAIISPRAYIARSATIGKGTIVLHDALVNSNAFVGDNCIINTKSVVEHDSRIENHCHISTGTIINGGTVVGAESFVGSNAVTQEYAVISEKSFIQAASLVKREQQ